MFYHWDNIRENALKLLSHKNSKVFSFVYSLYCLTNGLNEDFDEYLDEEEIKLFNDVDTDGMSYYQEVYFTKLISCRSIYIIYYYFM